MKITAILALAATTLAFAQEEVASVHSEAVELAPVAEGVAVVEAASLAVAEGAKIEAGCPCRVPRRPRKPVVCHHSSSSSVKPRQRHCGCPSSSSSACCKPVYCPRHEPSSSTSELPTAHPDCGILECPCCESSSGCGFLRAHQTPGWVDGRCECNPCGCDPCAGRRDDGCGC